MRCKFHALVYLAYDVDLWIALWGFNHVKVMTGKHYMLGLRIILLHHLLAIFNELDAFISC